MKKFLIIGNSNAVTYKEIFPLIKENKMWMGITLFCGKMPYFEVPLDTDISRGASHYYKDGKLFKQINSIAWYTNMEHHKRNEPLILTKKYNPNDYKKYDNYNGIEVSRVKNIPYDYDGIMGVPITFLDKYCPQQFDIIKFRKGDDDKDLSVDGKCPYFRILIKKK